MNIRLRAQTAGLQVQFSRILGDVLRSDLSGLGRGQEEADRLGFESSFVCAKPKECLGRAVLCGEDLYLLHSGTEEGLRGGGIRAGAKFGKVAAAMVTLGDVDLGWTSSADRDKVRVQGAKRQAEKAFLRDIHVHPPPLIPPHATSLLPTPPTVPNV